MNYRRLCFLMSCLLVLIVACGRTTPTPNQPTTEQPAENSEISNDEQLLPQPETPDGQEPGAQDPKTEETTPEPTKDIDEDELEFVLDTLATNTYYLSDLRPDNSSNAQGPIEKDSSNGSQAGGDGRTLLVNGKTYAKGFGTTAPSELVFDLGGVCKTFSAEVGIDARATNLASSVIFQVYADEVKLWESDLVIFVNVAKATGLLDVTSKQKLKLVVTDGGNGGQGDFADWLNPIVSCDAPPPALAPKDAQDKGYFGPLRDWPVIATHAALLPDSTVIAWYGRDANKANSADYNDQSKHNSTTVDLWTPHTNTHSRQDNQTTELFCSGAIPLVDGRLFVAGGHLGYKTMYPGSIHTNFFNTTDKQWLRGPDMTEGRWYPSLINLPNKEVLVIGGSSNETTRFNYIPDVWNPETNMLRRLSGASAQNRDFRHYYPWVHVAPNGEVFYSGSTKSMAYLSTNGAGSWSSTYQRDTLNRVYGSSVMYEPGKILIMGGGTKDNVTDTAVTIDLNNGVTATATTSMSSKRYNLNATLLPNGHVFVNGGNTSGINFDDTTSVYSSEIWAPKTGQWGLGASAQKPRNYHSVALLLPDATVWTAGGGGCGTKCNQQSAEIYYPPYLFKKDGSGLLASRPKLQEAPTSMMYNQSYTLSSTSTKNIQAVTLVALGSVTHAFNMGQRFIELPITSKSGNNLTVTSPANANFAPPGYYMLFVMNTNGVPSVARILQVH
ncbi:MAG: NPCBM/NEW2 domain-containing protein [Trueperaceae bacterium]